MTNVTAILAGLLLGMTILVIQLERHVLYQKSVIDWVDGWQVHMQPLVEAATGMIGVRLPAPPMEAFFVGGVLSRDGAERAQELLKASLDQQRAVRDAVRLSTEQVKQTMQELSLWEKANPIPQKPRWL